MSGKSTFLRTVGVNVVLAQSVSITFAASYRAPWLRVRTCLHVEDSLQAHTSYYQAEVEAIVSIVKDESPGECLCLFDELFRGTNTVDRIAGATAVLQYLIAATTDEHRDVPRSRRIVVAATHDLELVGLLAEHYDACHMADALDGSGLTFDYVVRPGATLSRNAILLLRLAGAPEPLVASALETVRTRERARPTVSRPS